MLGSNRRHIEHIAFNQLNAIVFGEHAGGYHHLVAVRGDSRSRRYECAAHGSVFDDRTFDRASDYTRPVHAGKTAHPRSDARSEHPAITRLASARLQNLLSL